MDADQSSSDLAENHTCAMTDDVRQKLAVGQQVSYSSMLQLRDKDVRALAPRVMPTTSAMSSLRHYSLSAVCVKCALYVVRFSVSPRQAAMHWM